MLAKCKRILQSCAIIGVKHTASIFVHRMHKQRFIQRMKDPAIKGIAQHSWQELCKRYEILHDDLIIDVQPIPFVQRLFANMPEDALFARVEMYAQDRFQVLGSDWYQLDALMWHTDIRLKQQGGQDWMFDATSFYADIAIQSGNTIDLTKDIKVPWELSRLQHLPLLGHAYTLTGDARYVDAFMRQVTHWQEQNPYLLGINWLCPMEVGLRAISLVLAIESFQTSKMITDDFRRNYTALLYDHFIYLEHNWEWYDGRTSNHYLSNLVGYLYLCYFFKDMFDVSDKLAWCIKQLSSEMDRQVFTEGASYEGSTRYHMLVTELFYHAKELAALLDISLPDLFHTKFRRMLAFIAWCRINDEDILVIGDHDAGRVTFAGLPQEADEPKTGLKDYVQFGLSIYRDKRWHISLRHHAYINRQPSGHFHNDVGSITLAVNEIPVLIDPGSYVYTASAVWRNYFRSAKVHNLMYLENREPIDFDERLFALALPECMNDLKNQSHKILQTNHTLYEHGKLMLERKVIVEKNALLIHDTAYRVECVDEGIYAIINFIFHHEIVLKKCERSWMIYHKDELLMRLISELEFTVCSRYYSPSYGVKKETTALVAKVSLVSTPIFYENRFELF